MSLTRRGVLLACYVWGVAFASGVSLWPRKAHTDNELNELVQRYFGRGATESDRVHLVMPATFPTGYIVPVSVDVDCPMTQSDHVRQIRIFAPQNPLVEVAGYHFVPERSNAHVSTRIRLAKPQFVVAVAEMNDGALLMAQTWVAVATDGCN